MINRRDQQAKQPPEPPFLVVADRATTTATTNMEHHHDLSPAPLWRNAPVLSTPAAAKTSTMIMSQVRPHQPVVASSSSSSSSSVIQSFQQSLRSYPSSANRKPVAGGAKIRPKSEYDHVVGDGATRCFVTNLENQSQQPVSSSFFLDYLEWNRQQQQQQQQQSAEQLTNNGNTGIRINEMAINEHQQQFDHSKFMDMFRTSHRRGSCGGQSTTKPMICESVESSSSLVAMNEADDDDQKSLPYSVNNDLENDSRWMKSAKDQQQPQLQQQQQSQKLAANPNVVKMRQTRRQVRIQERPKTISFSHSFHPSSSTSSPSMVIRNDNSNPVQPPRQTSQLPANPVTAAAATAPTTTTTQARPNKLLQKTTTTTTTTSTTRKHQQDCNNLLNTAGKTTTTNPTTPFTSVLSFNNHHHNHHQPIGGMERNSNRSQSNLNQRIQSAAERRSQIEDAKRERAQRQIEQSSVRNIIHGGGGGGGHFPSAMTSSYTHQSTRGEQPFLPGHSTNSSLAFGSTQPRNIDLTRPLVTPLAAQQQRPKSEIFTEPLLPFNVASGAAAAAAKMSKTVTDSSGPIYSKDDANYRINNNHNNGNNHTKFQNSATAPQAPVAEPMVVAKHQQQQQISFGGGGGFGGLMGASSGSRNMFSSSSSSQSSCGGASSFLRAGRRHDPELIPAKDKYLFRDYAAPSSGWSFGSGSHLKKENSMMTCSMTSTKSFQTKNLHPQSANNGSPGGFGKPKKSYSMNRLDQLAQPRKRVQPRVPISTSFVKGKTTPDSQTPTKSPSSVSAKSSSARLETPKPIPPPKNFAHTPKPQSHPGSKETTPSSGRSSSKKTRPLSQIEVKTDPSVFESPFEKEKEDKPGEEDSLAEYKKQLAEKRAQYRKQQEQKLKQLTKSKPDADGHNQDNDNDDDEHDGAKNDHKNSNDNKNTSKNTPRVVARRPRSTIIMSTASTGGNVESSPSQTANSDQSNQNNNNNNDDNNSNSNIKSLADETREVLEKQESNVLTTGAAPTSGADSGHAPTSSDSSASCSSSSSSSPSSTSSSSSSSLSSSNDGNKQTVQPVTQAKAEAEGSNLLVDLSPETDFSANQDGQNVDDNSSLMDISNDSLSKTIIDTNDDKSMEQLERKMDKLSTNEQGQTCDDSSVMQMDKALLQPNSIMTTSFDSSLLHSTSPAALQATAQQMTASPLNANSNSSLTAGQIEERQQEMLKRHEMERQKRKSRIQEILKGRTRKDDGTAGGGSGGGNNNNGGDLTSSADSSLETSGANSMQQPPQKRSSLSNGGDDNGDGDGADNNNKTNGHLTTNGGADTDQDLIKTNGFSNDNLLV